MSSFEHYLELASQLVIISVPVVTTLYGQKVAKYAKLGAALIVSIEAALAEFHSIQNSGSTEGHKDDSAQ